MILYIMYIIALLLEENFGELQSFILSRSPIFVSCVYSKTFCIIPFVIIVCAVKTKAICAGENRFWTNISENNTLKYKKVFAITNVPDDFTSQVIGA